MAKRATRSSVGVQDDGKNPMGETPFKLAHGSEAVILVEVHMANHMVVKY